MKESEIKFLVSLDENHVPDTIVWDATDKEIPGAEYTNAIMLSIWDNTTNETLRMDIWNKQMTVDDMKKFVINAIGGMATTIENATGDRVMSEKMHDLCRVLVKHVQEQN